jgi:cellulose biosynthesis protein BcsQ
MRSICIAICKGGTGKTTTAVTLAPATAPNGKPTIAVLAAETHEAVAAKEGA